MIARSSSTVIQNLKIQLFCLSYESLYEIMTPMDSHEINNLKIEIQNIKKQVEEQSKILQIQIQRIWKLEEENRKLAAGSPVAKEEKSPFISASTPVISPEREQISELPETKEIPPNPVPQEEVIKSAAFTPPQEEAPPSPAISKPITHPSKDKMIDLETEIGGNWLSKVGIAALFIGLAFLFKYAFDLGLLNNVVRVALGTLAGLVLLSLGEYFTQKKEYLKYAHVLTGGGLAILYLSFYAAYGFYHLIPRTAAWILLFGVTAGGVFFALRYKQEAIGVIGFLGAYLTPFFLKAPSDPYLSYLTYGFIITLGAFRVGYKNTWAIIQNMALIGGLLMAAGVTSMFEFSAETLPDITLLLYGFGISAIAAITSAKKNWNSFVVISIFCAILYVLLLGWSYEEPGKAINFLNLMTYSAGLLVLSYAIAYWKKWPECSYIGCIAGYILPIGLLPATDFLPVLAPYWALFIILTGVLYYLEGWLLPLGIGILAAHGMGISWMLKYYTYAQFGMAWGYLSLWAALFLVAAAASAWYAKKESSPSLILLTAVNVILYFAESYKLLDGRFYKGPGWFALGLVFYFLGAGRLGYRLNKEAKLFNESLLGLAGVFAVTAVPLLLEQHWIPVAWSAEAVMLNWLGLRFEGPLLRKASLTLLGAAIFRIFAVEYSASLNASWAYVPIINNRFVAFAAVAITAFVIQGLRINKEDILSPLEKKEIAGLLVLAGNFLLLFNFSVELLDFIDSYYGSRGSFWENADIWMLKQVSLSCLWAVYSLALICIGMAKRISFFRIVGLLLFALTILKVFFFDLSSLQQLYRIISFIVLGIILLGVSYLYHRFREKVLKILRD
jgi:uncharacterized membrane protein